MGVGSTVTVKMRFILVGVLVSLAVVAYAKPTETEIKITVDESQDVKRRDKEPIRYDSETEGEETDIVVDEGKKNRKDKPNKRNESNNRNKKQDKNKDEDKEVAKKEKNNNKRKNDKQ